MSAKLEKGSRIAHNTLLMYFRMFVTIIISLIVARIVLRALGVTDYGIYNLVGGVVTFFSFINAAMMAATQRFLNFELGNNNENGLRTVFKTAYIIHILLCGLIVIIGITLGKYLLDTKMQIPRSSMFSANVVLYASCFTCACYILSLPFMALIIAHERFNVYAIITIADNFLKLVGVLLLMLFPVNRLIIYAIILMVVQLIIALLYVGYCYRYFNEVRGPLVFNKEKFREMGSFAIWCIIGTLAGTSANQGISILLGIFFPPAILAARGIASQVQAAVITFGANLNTAMAPQITQSYASGDTEFFFNIIYKGSKYVLILMTIIAVPILLRTRYILELWLGEVPEYTVEFIRWLLFTTIIETISYSLMRASDASGKVKIYHIVVGGILLLIIPFVYLSLKITHNPISAFVVYFIINVCAWIARLIILRKTVNLSIKKYVRKVSIRGILIFGSSLVMGYLFTCLIPQNIIGLIITVIISVISTLGITYFIGLDAQEKIFINSKIQSYIK